MNDYLVAVIDLQLSDISPLVFFQYAKVNRLITVVFHCVTWRFLTFNPLDVHFLACGR